MRCFPLPSGLGRGERFPWGTRRPLAAGGGSRGSPSPGGRLAAPRPGGAGRGRAARGTGFAPVSVRSSPCRAAALLEPASWRVGPFAADGVFSV